MFKLRPGDTIMLGCNDKILTREDILDLQDNRPSIETSQPDWAQGESRTTMHLKGLTEDKLERLMDYYTNVLQRNDDD
jgi:hypothetical protein